MSQCTHTTFIGREGWFCRGFGTALEYRVCSQYAKPGHPSKEEITAKIRDERQRHAPLSGRFA